MTGGQRIRAADIEDDLINWFPAEMAALGWDVSVGSTISGVNSMAVYRVGGPMRDLVTDSATIVVECYASTTRTARSAAMALDARSLLHQLVGRELNGRGVSRVAEFGGPALLPIANAPTRYTQTFAVDIAADVIG